jgi:hypothetical protein
MRRHNISLSEPLSDKIQAQVKKGRFKDFSAAVQEAAWQYFGETIYDEYEVTPDEVERAFQRTLKEIDKARKGGQLKPWKK